VADTLVDPRRFKNLLRRLTALSFSPVWRDGLVVAITLLRGRERDEVLVGRDLQLLGGKPDEEVGDYVRLDWLNLALGGGHDRQTDQWWCRYHLVNPVVRRYKSTAGTQSMIWIAATVRTHVAALADRASVVEIARRWRTGWGELEPFRPLCVEAMQARHGSVEDYFIMAWNYGGLRPDQPWAQIGALLPDRTESSRAFFAAQLPPGDLRTAWEAATRIKDGADDKPAAIQQLRTLLRAGVRTDPAALVAAGMRADPTLEPQFTVRPEDATRWARWKLYVRTALAVIEAGGSQFPPPPREDTPTDAIAGPGELTLEQLPDFHPLVAAVEQSVLVRPDCPIPQHVGRRARGELCPRLDPRHLRAVVRDRRDDGRLAGAPARTPRPVAAVRHDSGHAPPGHAAHRPARVADRRHVYASPATAGDPPPRPRGDDHDQGRTEKCDATIHDTRGAGRSQELRPLRVRRRGGHGLSRRSHGPSLRRSRCASLPAAV
jgi:hypothetical protein